MLCARGLCASEQREPSPEMAMVTVLLELAPPVLTVTGTKQPVGASGGNVKTIWSRPAQQGVRPLYCTLAAFPPTNTSVETGRLPATGAILSANVTGPSPVPYRVMT